MPVLSGQTFPLLKEGQYVLKTKKVGNPEHGDYQGDATCQVRATVEVVEVLTDKTQNWLLTDEETEAVGHQYDEYWSLDPNTEAVRRGSKLWLIYEAATGFKLDPDDEIDTDDMLEKEFQARIVINKPGTRNRTEHESYGKVKRGKGKSAKVDNPGETTKETEANEANDTETAEIPF